jgi:ABC-type multidrug transport system fused ATPase/permease subunit
MKRHEAVLRSSVFARFSEAITGTPTLRSYGVTGEFSRRIKDAIDNMDSAYFLTIANQRWLTIRLDVISVVCVFVTGILVVTNTFSVDPSIAGLVLSYMVSIAQALQFSVRQVADVENNMNATERIHYYGHSIPQEADHKAGTADPPADWPQRGEIVFQAVQLRYRPNLPLVLHDFTLQIRPGEKLAIVGRTGAGKSSIMTALFRIVEPAAGSITIDGVDIASVSLHTLRSRMAIIPQDATLLRGTIRSNLDPFGQRSDLELWSALRKVHLVPESGAETGPGHKLTLETAVEAEGANFSVGERQLLALARALVRDARIVVADEATSSIDFESDARIQKAMVRGFRGKTLLCIAHRLKTIIGYDRVCVIEDGRVVELDTPMALFEVSRGRFRQMCEESRIGREEIEVAGRFVAGDGGGEESGSILAESSTV